MPRNTYTDLCVAMDRRGGYMSNAIGMCQRELIAVQQKQKSRSDLFLADSATYAAFLRNQDLGARFDASRAEPAALVWTHDLKTGQKCPPFPVAVDWASGVVRQENTKVFGLLEDVRHCLVRRSSGGRWEPCTGPMGKQPAGLSPVPPLTEDFDRFTTMKPSSDGKGRARIHQDWYREQLFDLWEGRCAVTGCNQPELLRASHIVAWKDATGKERLDPANGLLLAAHLDAAFDKSLISFSADGTMLFSPRFNPSNRTTLGLHPRMRLQQLPAATAAYLARHRAHYGFGAAPTD